MCFFDGLAQFHAEEPARRAPELFWEASPVVERQRPAAQARIARDRILLVDAAQDRVIFYLAVTELLPHTLAQGVVVDERCPGDVPDARDFVPRLQPLSVLRNRGAIIILPLGRELRDLIPL